MAVPKFDALTRRLFALGQTEMGLIAIRPKLLGAWRRSWHIVPAATRPRGAERIPQMKRYSVDVVQELLHEMDRVVTDYHPRVGRTDLTVAGIIDGTGMFPGGCGLWRGDQPFGPLPKLFPEHPLMFVAHNWGTVDQYSVSKRKGGEAASLFWSILRGYVDDPTTCFFTNALMGLQPTSAIGPMPTVPGYEDQCLAFLRKQIAIVEPRIVVALGGNAHRLLTKVMPQAPYLMHPSARQFKALVTRAQRVAAQAAKLRELLG